MGVNFRTGDGVVHTQLTEVDIVSGTLADQTTCGIVLVTNPFAKPKRRRGQRRGVCTDQRATCMMCLSGVQWPLTI